MFLSQYNKRNQFYLSEKMCENHKKSIRISSTADSLQDEFVLRYHTGHIHSTSFSGSVNKKKIDWRFPSTSILVINSTFPFVFNHWVGGGGVKWGLQCHRPVVINTFHASILHLHLKDLIISSYPFF